MAVSQVCKEETHKKPWIAWVTSSVRCQSSSCSLLSAKAALGAFGGQELQALYKEELQPRPCAAKLTVTAGFCAGMTGAAVLPLSIQQPPTALPSSQLPPAGVRPGIPAQGHPQHLWQGWDSSPGLLGPPQSCQLLQGEDSGQDFPTSPHFPSIAALKGAKYPSLTSAPGGIVDRQNPELLSPGFLSLLHGSRPGFSKNTRNLPWTCPRFAASRKPSQFQISLTNQLWGKQLLWWKALKIDIINTNQGYNIHQLVHEFKSSF